MESRMRNRSAFFVFQRRGEQRKRKEYIFSRYFRVTNSPLKGSTFAKRKGEVFERTPTVPLRSPPPSREEF